MQLPAEVSEAADKAVQPAATAGAAAPPTGETTVGNSLTDIR